MRPLCFLSFLLLFSPGWSQDLKPLTHPVGLAEKIVIRGYRGKLQVIPGNSNILKVEGKKLGKIPLGQWTLQLNKKENILEVSVGNFPEQGSWEKIRSRDQRPSFDIKVTAPFKPVEIFWDEGQVSVSWWKESLSVQMTRGSMDVKEGRGPLILQLIKGEIKVSNHIGDIDIQSFGGKVFVKKTKGILGIDNHLAVCEVRDHQGNLNLRNYSGVVTTNRTRGSFLVRNISGKLRLRGLEGVFKGHFDGGSLDAKIKSLENFVLKGEETSVNLKVPERSGANVNLQSQKGRIIAPRYLRKINRGRWKERRGQLKGREQGDIKVISKYGEIVFR